MIGQGTEEQEMDSEGKEGFFSSSDEDKGLILKEYSEEEFIRLQDYTIGQLLRQDQAGLCEIIYRSPQLFKKIFYCFSLSLLFSLLYGGILASKSGITASFVMAIKVPCLLFSSILICGPLLFTLNMFLGVPLNFLRLSLLLLVSNFLMSSFLLASAGILLLFILFAPDMFFLNILNIIFFVIAIGFGIAFIWRATTYLIKRSKSPHNTFAIKIWSVIYVLVGLQLAWGIQVFGDISELPIFKQMKLEGNFYMVVFQLIQRWMGD